MKAWEGARMFGLLILPQMLPHLEVYEQALVNKSKQSIVCTVNESVCQV